MSTIQRSTVQKIASLARLDLAGEAETRLATDLERIVDYIRVLDELDLCAEAPENGRPVALRADLISCESRVDEMLAGAPDSQGHHIRVPAVMTNKGKA
mgnify:CR=1 FL=1